MNRRQVILGTGTVLLCGELFKYTAYACTPAKFKFGQLVEVKTTGVRLFAVKATFSEKQKMWVYGLAFLPSGEPVVEALENTLIMISNNKVQKNVSK